MNNYIVRNINDNDKTKLEEFLKRTLPCNFRPFLIDEIDSNIIKYIVSDFQITSLLMNIYVLEFNNKIIGVSISKQTFFQLIIIDPNFENANTLNFFNNSLSLINKKSSKNKNLDTIILNKKKQTFYNNCGWPIYKERSNKKWQI